MKKKKERKRRKNMLATDIVFSIAKTSQQKNFMQPMYVEQERALYS